MVYKLRAELIRPGGIVPIMLLVSTRRLHLARTRNIGELATALLSAYYRWDSTNYPQEDQLRILYEQAIIEKVIVKHYRRQPLPNNGVEGWRLEEVLLEGLVLIRIPNGRSIIDRGMKEVVYFDQTVSVHVKRMMRRDTRTRVCYNVQDEVTVLDR